MLGCESFAADSASRMNRWTLERLLEPPLEQVGLQLLGGGAAVGGRHRARFGVRRAAVRAERDGGGYLSAAGDARGHGPRVARPPQPCQGAAPSGTLDH